MRRDIDIGLLRAFIAVAETGGMTAAGRLLNLTQAAVSQQIKRLEELLQSELFDRDQKQLRLTYAGERLRAHAERLVGLNDEVFGMMTVPTFEGDVRLGVPHDIVGVFMPSILRGFAAARPRVRVSLVCTTTPILLERMERGEIELTLTTEEAAANGDDHLLPDALHWTGARGGAAHRRDPLPVALGDETCAFRSSALSALRRSGREWHLLCQIGHTAPMLAMLEADLAVAPMMASVIPDNLEIIRPSERLPALPVFHVNLRTPKLALSAAAAELARQIRDEFRCRYRKAA